MFEELRFVYDGWNVILVLDGQGENDNGIPVTTVNSKYTWGLDLSGWAGNSTTGGIHGAGGVGGLLAVEETATAGTPAYWFLYDGNGNVGQLVRAGAPPALAAHYEYGPYGDYVAFRDVDGQGYVYTNPWRFSTKWYDNIGLYYYGYRYYEPTLGRWLSWDPIGEADQSNQYGYVRNRPADIHEFLGLWGTDIHSGWTSRWARFEGMKDFAADLLGSADDDTDSEVGTAWYPDLGGDQSRHFDRSSAGPDTRLTWRNRELQNALDDCVQHDWPRISARDLGRSLHSIQDYWAHGDYSKGPEDTWQTRSFEYDKWGDDAVGTSYGVAAFSDGRPPQVFTWGPVAPSGAYRIEVSWTSWQPGPLRMSGTIRDSTAVIKSFLSSIGAKGQC